jgi:hypothetical protein
VPRGQADTVVRTPGGAKDQELRTPRFDRQISGPAALYPPPPILDHKAARALFEVSGLSGRTQGDSGMAGQPPEEPPGSQGVFFKKAA